MKKLFFLIVALLMINSAKAQVGVAFNNITTTCPFRVTIYAHDATNTACNYYTSVPLSAAPGVTLLSWSMLNAVSIWGGTPPDMTTIVIDGFCVDFGSVTCSGSPACVGDVLCGWPGITNTLSLTCSCNNNAPVYIGFTMPYFNGNQYYQCKMVQ